MYPVQTIEEIFSPAYYANPYPTLEYLRDTQPVSHSKDPFGNSFWLLSRYEDVDALLKDRRFSKRPLDRLGFEDMMPVPNFLKPLLMPLLMPILNNTFGPMMNNMLDMDDPDHARLRGLVHKVFTPKLVAKMQERIDVIVNRLIDAAIAKGEMEFIADFAFPLPVTVIAEILGVPASDQDKFQRWSRTLVDALNNPNMLRMIQDTQALTKYLREKFDERRKHPQEDLISDLVQVEEAGDTLNQDELLAMAVLLLTAGHETTVNLLGNGLFALLQHPEQFAMLKENPSLVKTAVEEILRYDSPVHLATERYALEDLVINGVKIAKGDKVLAGLAAANRDPEQFVNPDEFDICREPNRHLAFGQGIHYCVGAPLARMEGTMAFRIFLERLPDLRLALPLEKIEYRPSMFLRGLKTLPVRF